MLPSFRLLLPLAPLVCLPATALAQEPSGAKPPASAPADDPDRTALARDGHPMAGWHNGLFYLRDYNDNFGFGLRLFVAGAPLSLDFGIPLKGDHYNKKGSQFNFSFGTRF